MQQMKTAEMEDEATEQKTSLVSDFISLIGLRNLTYKSTLLSDLCRAERTALLV